MVNEKNRLIAEMERTPLNDNRKRGDLKKKVDAIDEKLRKFKLLNDIYEKSRDAPVKLQFRVFFLQCLQM